MDKLSISLILTTYRTWGDRYRITVHEKLKQTKPGRHLEPIELLAFPEDKELCVVQHLREYIHRTDPSRKDHSQLLLSYVKPFKPVAKGHCFQMS